MDKLEISEATQTQKTLQPATLQLHPEPDARLVVGIDATSEVGKGFAVSSAVLIVASDYFSTLLRSDFKEGVETRRGDCPTIVMKEDDPQAMETILSLLHYQNLQVYDRLKPRALAAVAIQSDKYDFTRALRPWISLWFRNVSGTSNADELGFLLVAAYFLRASGHFTDISARLVRQSKADLESVWVNHDMIDLLPQGIKGVAQSAKTRMDWETDRPLDALIERVSQILQKLHRELQSVESLLRNQERGYEMNGRVCMVCGRRLPATAKKCHPCYNSTLQEEYCTTQTRIAEYFLVLGRSDLWPSVGPFQKCTISELANRFARVKEDCQHRCDAGMNCPLVKALEGLCERVDRILKNIRGVPLECSTND